MIKLLHGNAVELLRDLPNESVDLVVTDPPYRLIGGGRTNDKGAPSGILAANDGRLFRYNDIQPEEWLPEVYRVMKSGTHCYVMINVLNIEKYLTVMREIGFGLHNILAWEKNNCTPSRWYMKNAEYVIFARKGKAKPINFMGSKTVHAFDNIIGGKRHPTEKPVDLMEYYIKNSSAENDIVLDPFMGAGSSGVAAVDLHRSFIGMEIDGEYFAKAKARISERKGQSSSSEGVSCFF